MKATRDTNPFLIDEHKNLFSQLCPTRNDLGKVKKLRTGSNKAVWWICTINKDHIWDDSIYHRVGGRSCPYCRGFRVNHTNSLRALGGSVAEEFHPTKNKPENIDTLYGHSGKKVWWLCKNGHEWQARIHARNRKSGKEGTNCQKCSSQTSLPEIRIYAELKHIFPDAEWREMIDGIELDIFLPSLKVGVEYDGAYWHAGKEEKDREKNEDLKNLNISVLRVREKQLDKIGNDDLLLDGKLTKNHLNSILEQLAHLVRNKTKNKNKDYISQDNYLNIKEYNRIVGFLPKNR